MYTKTQNELKTFIKGLMEEFEGDVTFRAKTILDAGMNEGYEDTFLYKHICKPEFRVKRGWYDVSLFLSDGTQDAVAPVKKASESSVVPTETKAKVQPKPAAQPEPVMDLVNELTYIPDVDKTFVRWGNTASVQKIVASKMFFPLYIYGPSGNGKTMMVQQVCAALKRKFIRVNLSPETDEDDLIGGFRLIDGSTVFNYGPVVRAMKEGAVLLLDELDRVSNKIMCLQSVMEGNSILIKKTGETVHPAPGFTIIGTANTGGRGSDDGRYNAAQVIDDAFLERFPVVIEQGWPTKSIEKKIVMQSMERYDCANEDFADKLVSWASIIRKTYEREGVDEVVSTRRLDHIIKTFSIFNDRAKAIQLATARFNEETSTAFMEVYAKVDAGLEADFAEDSSELSAESNDW